MTGRPERFIRRRYKGMGIHTQDTAWMEIYHNTVPTFYSIKD